MYLNENYERKFVGHVLKSQVFVGGRTVEKIKGLVGSEKVVLKLQLLLRLY